MDSLFSNFDRFINGSIALAGCYISKRSPCLHAHVSNLDPLKPQFYKVNLGFTRVYKQYHFS